MNNLQIIKSENFGTVKCDFYKDYDSNIWMTREQIGTALEYSEPMKAIAKIHERHGERLNKFSFVALVNGRNTYFYSAKGIYEICRWSQQTKADKFYDWVYEILEGLRKGELNLIKVPKTLPEALRAYADEVEKRMLTEHKLLVMAPKADFFDQVADSKDAIEIGNAAKVLNMGIGRNNLFKFLREKRILQQNNIPYQEYIDRGYFRTIEQKWTTPEGETKINIKTLVYQKGLDYIRKLLNKEVPTKGNEEIAACR